MGNHMTDLNAAFGVALTRLWPHGDSRVPGLIAGIIASAPAVFAKYGISSDLVVAHAMAEFSEESGAGTEMQENMNYSAARLLQVFPTHFTHDQAIFCWHGKTTSARIYVVLAPVQSIQSGCECR
jgi:predicted chitinase